MPSSSLFARLALFVFAAGALPAPASAVLVYSLSDVSTSVPGIYSAEDIIECPGFLHTPGSGLGLAGLDDLDAMAFAPDSPGGFGWSFSVDTASSLPAGDIYATQTGNPGVSFLQVGASGLGQVAGDDSDALDQHIRAFVTGVGVFSLRAGNSFGFSGADLLAPGVVPTVAFSAADLGLVASDEIDAVHLMAGMVFFSLAPGSASLGGGSGADIFVSAGTGSFALHTAATDLGLLASDNVDALSQAVPEPGVVALLAGGGWMVSWAGRRRSSRR